MGRGEIAGGDEGTGGEPPDGVGGEDDVDEGDDGQRETLSKDGNGPARMGAREKLPAEMLWTGGGRDPATTAPSSSSMPSGGARIRGRCGLPGSPSMLPLRGRGRYRKGEGWRRRLPVDAGVGEGGGLGKGEEGVEMEKGGGEGWGRTLTEKQEKGYGGVEKGGKGLWRGGDHDGRDRLL